MLMGFGHRVYKNYDPRARIIQKACHDVLDELGIKGDPLLDLAMELEKIALNDSYFVDRKLYPNVDFYSGIILKAMGFPTSMFTALFAVSRTVGLGQPVAGDDGGPGAADRAAAADLHRARRSATTCRSSAGLINQDFRSAKLRDCVRRPVDILIHRAVDKSVKQ